MTNSNRSGIKLLRSVLVMVGILRLSGGAIKETAVRMIRNAQAQARYPGLRCHNSSELIIHGKLTVKGRVNIGRRTRITIADGCHLIFEGENEILDDVLIGPGQRMAIGRGTSVQDHCILLGCVDIGPYCLLAPRVFASSGQHSFKGHGNLPAWVMIRLQDYLQPYQGSPISVGPDCWLGINSVILPGCRLGQGSIVAAGSVLRGVYDANYRVIAGSPGAYVGQRWIGAGMQLSS